MIDERLAGHHTAHIWPPKARILPHEDPRFLIGYMPLEFAGEKAAEQDRLAIEFLSKYGDKPAAFVTESDWPFLTRNRLSRFVAQFGIFLLSSV